MLQTANRFTLGRLFITPAARAMLTDEDIQEALQLHLQGDWGVVSTEDWQANDAALKEGERLLSAYETGGGCRYWVITEWNRSYTTVLLPEDY